MDNVVPCCSFCNHAKSDLTLFKFYEWIPKLHIKEFTPPTKLLDLPQQLDFKELKRVYQCYLSNYKTMEIDRQTFYTYSQLPCHYCGDIGYNCTSKNFKYNGIDRVDNSKRHELENIVPCCGRCNLAKHHHTLEEFGEWINRIQNFQKEKSNG